MKGLIYGAKKGICLALLVTFLILSSATGMKIVPDKQLISPGNDYVFTIEGADGEIEGSIINNATKATMNWDITVKGDTITVQVPENADFSEYILRVKASGEEGVAQMVIKPQTGIILTVFAVPLFISACMLAGGAYVIIKKRGVLRYVGVGVALLGALILFGIVMTVVVFKMV